MNVICSLQSGVLARLINKNTLNKMSENEILNGKKHIHLLRCLTT